MVKGSLNRMLDSRNLFKVRLGYVKVTRIQEAFDSRNLLLPLIYLSYNVQSAKILLLPPKCEIITGPSNHSLSLFLDLKGDSEKITVTFRFKSEKERQLLLSQKLEDR